MPLRIDFTNMMGDVVDGGIAPADWSAASTAFESAHAGLVKRRDAGELGFLALPGDDALHRQSTDFAARANGRFDDVVVLGIGGSALGPIAMRTALLEPAWNTLSDRERGGRPRLHVLDNVDPRTISALLNRLNLEKSLFVVTSKSGGTAETMAQYLVIRERVEAGSGKAEAGSARAKDHFVFVTDPQKG